MPASLRNDYQVLILTQTNLHINVDSIFIPVFLALIWIIHEHSQ